ncbi:MAG: glycosyltransferase family 2 protein [Flavobacterium sp.]|nr:glycosyltransferase family 2 protein [Flavobacterium sp.]
MPEQIFSILIATKNRKADLLLTLEKIKFLFEQENVSCTVYDDGSNDGTYNAVKQNFPEIELKRNEISKGYIFCRNQMLNETTADYAISLDDDSHFISDNPLYFIQKHFSENPNCGLIAFRIFWGLKAPEHTSSQSKSFPVNGFVGCGHVWRMESWRQIPNYPEWFIFYSEEEFAAKQLFHNGIAMDYLPEVLVHHRVDVKSRKKQGDYTKRLRNSLRNGWFLYFLFDPLQAIPRKMAYSIWMQVKLKVIKGDWKAASALTLAFLDLIIAIPKVIKNRKPFSLQQYRKFQQIEKVPVYWQPESD